MDLNKHVYCVDCIHFRLDDEVIPYCYHEDDCNINNFEDSMVFKDRPCYEEINVNNKK